MSDDKHLESQTFFFHKFYSIFQKPALFLKSFLQLCHIYSHNEDSFIFLIDFSAGDCSWLWRPNEGCSFLWFQLMIYLWLFGFKQKISLQDPHLKIMTFIGNEQIQLYDADHAEKDSRCSCPFQKNSSTPWANLSYTFHLLLLLCPPLILSVSPLLPFSITSTSSLLSLICSVYKGTQMPQIFSADLLQQKGVIHVGSTSLITAWNHSGFTGREIKTAASFTEL